MDQMHSFFAKQKSYQYSSNAESDEIKELEKRAKNVCVSIAGICEDITEIKDNINELKIEEIQTREKLISNGEKITQLKKLNSSLQTKYDLFSKESKGFEELVKHQFEDPDFETHLGKLSKTLGLEIQMKKVGEKVFMQKFIFSNNKYFIILYNAVSNQHSLQEMEPQHSKFGEIQSRFNESRDIRSLLYFLRAYFMNHP